MTKPPRGPSLAQARDLMNNRHSHFHQHNNRSPYREDQAHQHQHQHRHHQQQQHQERQVPNAAGVLGNVDSYVTRVVQTISIVQVVDGAGNPIEIQTHFAEPATIVVDPGSGITVSAPGLGAAAVVPTSESVPAVPTYDADPAPAPTSGDVLADTTPAPAPEYSVVSPESLDDISSALSTAGSPAFPTISAALNSTLPSSFHSLSNNTSSVHLLAVPESASLDISTTSYSSISNRRSSSLITTTTTFFSSSTTATASSVEGDADPTPAVGGGVGGGGSEGDAAAAATPTADSSDDSTPETGVIVGSVFGSIAGIALVAVLVLLALRWKKRNGGRIALGEEVSRGLKGALPAGGGGSSSDEPAMTQRSLPWGAGALAGMGAKRASRSAPAPPSPPADSGERSFYRVSGRKLPSVFESGGDGYTDPRENPFGNHNRESAFSSGDSVLFRDSQAFFDEPSPNDTLGRLAVGSPMRPISGVPIMRSGPAKTPVTEANPFADPLPELQPPSRDPIGRSLGSQDGSRGSGSRFTEEIR